MFHGFKEITFYFEKKNPSLLNDVDYWDLPNYYLVILQSSEQVFKILAISFVKNWMITRCSRTQKTN